MNKSTKTVSLVLIFASIFILALGLIPSNQNNQNERLNRNLSSKKKEIEKQVPELIQLIKTKPYNQINDDLLNINFQIFDHGVINYWSDNSYLIDTTVLQGIQYQDWKRVKLQNVDLEICKYWIEEDKELAVIIPIQSNFNYTNDYLTNEINENLVKGIHLNARTNKNNPLSFYLIFVLLFYGAYILSEKTKRKLARLTSTIAFNLIALILIVTFLKTDISIGKISDVNLTNLALNLIILLNATVLYNELALFKKPTFINSITFITAIFILFQLVNYIHFEKIKTFAIQKQIEEIKAKGYFEEDPLNKLLLTKIDKDLKKLSEDSLNSYLSNERIVEKINLLTSDLSLQFENKVEFIDDVEVLKATKDRLNTIGRKINSSNFYQLALDRHEYNYIGIFTLNLEEKRNFSIQIKPRKDIKSLSFPNLLAPKTNKINIQSILIKDNKILKFESGNRTKDQKYYSDENKTVEIGIEDTKNWIEFWLYQFYIVVFGFLLIRLITYFKGGSDFKQNSLFSKFQWLFGSLIIVSFLGILFFSSRYIKIKSEENQIEILNKKKFYIQSALQEAYYWIDDLQQISAKDIQKNLLNLAYIYQTDIHLYDFNGKLVASSQPILFEQNILSSIINPTLLFSNKFDQNLNEKIGRLNYIAGYKPLVNGDYLQLGFISIPQYLSESDRMKELEKFTGSLIHFYVFIILLAFVIMKIVSDKFTLPIKLMVNKLKVMSIDGKNERIDYESNDEIGQLVKQYNLAVGKLEESVRLLAQSEREAAWRTMARQIAHEINNPLTPMKLTIQQLQRSRALNPEHFEQSFERSANSLIEQINQLSGIAGTFSNFARLPVSKFIKTDIAARLYNTYQLFANNHEHIAISYSGVQNGIYILGDSDQIGQVFTNIIKNAIQAIPNETTGEVHIHIHKDQKKVTIDIKDSGRGIEEEAKDKLFVPNFTTKSTGMGLGLAIVKNIVELHKGHISFTSAPGNGSNFKFTFDTISGLSD